MTKFFRGAVMTAMVCGLFLAQSSVASAQTVKDRAAVVWKVSSIDNVLDSVAYMVGEAGFRQFVPAITLGAGAFLDGFDTSRPLGGYVTLDDGVPGFVGFLPVDDLGDVIDMLENNGVEIEEDGGDYIVFMPTGEELVIRGKGKWAYFSVNAEMLDDLPADPTKIVADIDDEYVLGVKAYVQRIPAELRSQAIEWMEEAFEETYNNQPEGIAEFQRKMNKNSLDQLADMIQQADQIFMGFAADKKNKRLYGDFTFTGKSGSDLAKQLTAGKGANTDFSAFLEAENAAVTFNAAAKVGKQDTETAKATLSVIREELGNLVREDSNVSEEDAELIEELVGEMLDVLTATLESGRMDFGGAVLVDDNGLNAVVGAHVADAKKVEAAVKKLISEKGDKLPPQIDVELDAEDYKGFNMHLFSGSIPEEEAQAILGETTTLVAGISSNKVYFGFGASPVEKVKAMIDQQSPKKAEVASQVNIKISPILRMIGETQDEAMLVQMAEKLEEGGNEMIRITSGFIENGQRSRVEVQDGILGLIEIGAAGIGGGGGGGFGGDF